MFLKYSIYKKPTNELLTSLGDFFCGEVYYIIKKYKYPNGTIYSGEWLKLQKHGFGRQFNRDGSYYEGNW